jgi:hypothetical protein
VVVTATVAEVLTGVVTLDGDGVTVVAVEVVGAGGGVTGAFPLDRNTAPQSAMPTIATPTNR